MQGGEGGKMTCSGRLRREGEKRKKGLVVWVFFFFFYLLVRVLIFIKEKKPPFFNFILCKSNPLSSGGQLSANVAFYTRGKWSLAEIDIYIVYFSKTDDLDCLCIYIFKKQNFVCLFFGIWCRSFPWL